VSNRGTDANGEARTADGREPLGGDAHATVPCVARSLPTARV
jgi:hypothetical protein